jgi:hypothetical protein
MRLNQQVVLIAALFAATAIGLAGETNTAVRPAHWAQKIEVAGIKNCY